jgi:hypothetical protein
VNHSSLNHVPHDLLLQFAEGELDENLAVHIADHIDGCPTCLARAAALEPLTGVLAQVPDPEPPGSLIEAILAAARSPATDPAAGTPPVAEPLARPAAPSPSPALPEDLPVYLPWTQVGLGLAMLVLAAALSLAADPAVQAIATDPAGLLSRAVVATGMVASAGHALRVGLGAGPLGLGMATAMALFGLIVTARLALEQAGISGAELGEQEGGAT